MFHFNPNPIPTYFLSAHLLNSAHQTLFPFTKLLHQEERKHNIPWCCKTLHGNEIFKCTSPNWEYYLVLRGTYNSDTQFLPQLSGI